LKLNFEEMGLDKINELQDKIENNSEQIQEIIDSIIQPYCKDLDRYVLFIKDCLKDGEKPPTDLELEDFCMNLSTYIYFAGGMVEQLGIKDDISKAVYKEMYHTSRASIDKGTVADKDSLAELASQEEQVVNICYNRAFKIMKAKVENAQELLSSCKKVLSRRIGEYNVSQMTN